ncbi:hypothetical protein SO802_033781 [Lithocarpus litseifolius]|uniref:STAS domain-containing protein n=1 Tax=Lithocarpus litseifolius TaxID=425828 RepID=A0AAW2BE02_9ROSI
MTHRDKFLKADLIAGITIASLAIPQGISYAKLANLPPILGLYSSFVPPLVYALMGSSRDLAVGTVAVASLLTGAMLGEEVNALENPKLYLHLAFTATSFAGVFQACLGFLRFLCILDHGLGFIVDFLSHATIVGFMAGAATVVCLQQLKGILGLAHFTHGNDLVSVMRSVFSPTHQWRWESGVLGCCFLFFLISTRYFSQRRPKFFWIAAMAPLTSVILGSLLVYLTHAEKHGVQIGELKKGLNPPSFGDLVFVSPYLTVAIKTGIITGVIALAEGIAVGRSFAMFKNYHIDGNKEMITFGMMNIVGSCTSGYLTTGPFSRSAVNYNAGCKTALSNIVMAMNIALSLLRVLLFIARPRTVVLGNIPNSMIYKNVEQYPNTNNVPGILMLEIDAPIYFASSSYLREWWIDEEEDRIKSTGETSLQYVILDMGVVGNIDSSGISMMEEVKKIADRRGLKDPPGTLDCQSHHEELTLRVPMVDDRALTIVRLLGLEGLHLLATQLAVLNWFNEESYEYKFIKKALEDVDEVDRIHVPANDEAANQTEIPDVRPSTSSAASVAHHRPTPTAPLATDPVPLVSTPQDTTEPPMPPIPPIDTGSPSWFTHAEFESSPHTTTIDHNSPMAPSYSSPQTVIPTPSLQTPHIELMSTSPSHTQSPPTSSILIHVPQATHPHDSDVEQGQCYQAEQPQDANAHAPPKRKSTRAIQLRRCGTSSHLESNLFEWLSETERRKMRNSGICALGQAVNTMQQMLVPIQDAISSGLTIPLTTHTLGGKGKKANKGTKSSK